MRIYNRMFLDDVIKEIERIRLLNDESFSYKIHIVINNDKNGFYIGCRKYLVVIENENGHEIFCQEEAGYIDIQFDTTKEQIQNNLAEYGWKV